MDIPDKFWKEWVESDMINRPNCLLPLLKNSKRLFQAHDLIKKKMGKKFADETVARCLNSYFEDLESYIILMKNKK